MQLLIPKGYETTSARELNFLKKNKRLQYLRIFEIYYLLIKIHAGLYLNQFMQQLF